MGNLLKALEEAEKNQAGTGLNLKFDLAEIILKELKIIDRNPEWLAKRVGISNTLMYRILNVQINITFKLADMIAKALKIKLKLEIK